VIRTLASDYVNAWVLAKDLDAIAQRSGDEDIADLCAKLKENYGYPVDSVLVTPDLRVVGHVNVNQPEALLPELYARFLRRGLAAARGEELPPEPMEEPGVPPAPPLWLTPEKPEGTVLDLVRVAKPGSFDMRLFPLDASAFTGPGEISIDVRLGTAEATGTFELCVTFPEAPEMMAPVQTLERLGPGQGGTLTHAFERGALFGLVVKGDSGQTEGTANAFLAKIRVRAR
jgi:hypothetical protein